MTNNNLQTILGSGGSIGYPLALELKNYTGRIRLVSRKPSKVNESDELMSADFSSTTEIDAAVTGSEIVYVTVGFDYNRKVWKEKWPPFVAAVIDACKKHNSKLVFFDNVYMYAKSAIPFMTEESPWDPPSEKGKVRRLLNEMIMKEVENGSLRAMIVRSADFYGPYTDKSMLIELAAKNLLKGKKAQAFGDINRIHTYTYTPDAAKATALLGNTPDAYNQVWHLPTTREKLTSLDWINLIGKEIGVNPKIQPVPLWMIRMLGLFIPIMREFPEMIYQNESDYFFDSSKFSKRFGEMVTPPAEGVRVMMNYLKTRQI